MKEAEKAEQQAAVDADDSEQDYDDEEEVEGGETPMMAVWLTLAAILVAGLYGLYLGAGAKSKQKADTAATSAYTMPASGHLACSAPRNSAIGRRQA
jgi:hypothetical protein